MNSHYPATCESVFSVWYQSGDWLDGPLVLSLEDRGLFQGAIAIERLRTFNHQIFCLSEHLTRFARSTTALALDAGEALSAMPDVLAELLRRNGEPADVGIVILATPGLPGSKQPTIIAHLASLDLDRFVRLQNEGERLVITSVQQPSAASIPRAVKHRSRLHYYLANQQARNVDPSAVAVLVDADGTITETASANILLVADGVLHSPPPETILPGVTLGVVRQIAESLKIPWREQPLSPQQFYDADEILLTGTGPGVWFANGRRGPIFEAVRAAYDQRIGQQAR